MKKLSFVGWFLAASSVVLALGSCQEEQLPATISGLPDGDITFLWNDTGSKTVSIESNYDWTFEEEDEHDIIEVTRTQGTNDLVIKPDINYDRKAYTASIRITAGSGSAAAERVITVSQGANSDTYLNFLDADLAGQDNPIIMFESRPDGEPTVKEILISTNNVLSVEVSADQDVTIPGTEEPSEPEEDEETGETQAAPVTKVEIPDYGWMSYGISSRQTEEGPVTVLTLTCQMNESPTASLTLAIDVVSGNEDIDNTIETKRIGLVSMPSTPAIVVNPQEGLTFAYNDDKPQTFSVAANVEYDDLTETENATYHWFTKSGSWDSGYPVVTLAEDNGNVKVYSVTVPANYAAEDRQVSLSFRQRNEGEGLDPVYAEVIFTQTAAPQASVSLNETVLIINSDRQNATLTVETSIPELTTVECLDDSGEKADWFQAEYNALINQIVIEFGPAGEEERNGTLTVNVGTGMNKASASVDIIQLSTQPSLMLNPASVQLNQAGDPVTVSVITNQDSWSIDSSVSSDFSIVEDHEANTITISGTEVTSGERTATYTVTAGEKTAQLAVSQAVAYKLGDPYVVNGKTVGIVYEVDADGMHGKAFSLTVDNMNERVFFAEAGWLEPDYVAGIAENALPLSMTDGQDNCERMKNEPGWSEKFQLLKWVEDLGDEQGVDWYIPSIEELKDLLEYMSGASFKTVQYEISDTDGNKWTYDLDAIDIDESATVEVSWNRIRGLYSTYTGPGSGYDEEQYVVFEPYTSLSDPGDHRHLVDDPYLKKGDNNAYKWISSTVITNSYSTYVYYVGMKDATTGYPYPTVRDNINAISDTGDGISLPIDYDANTGSVHPICRF